VSDMKAYFEQELKAKGWRVTGVSDIQGAVSMVFERGPEDAEKKDGGWLAMSTEDGKTMIALVLALAVKQ